MRRINLGNANYFSSKLILNSDWLAKKLAAKVEMIYIYGANFFTSQSELDFDAK